jgi:hypothetical protein
MYAGPDGNETVKTKERKKFIAKHLKRGKVPAQVIELVMEEYGLAYDTSYQLVYAVNKQINDSLRELYDNAAEYLTRNLQGLASEAMEDKDRKSALKSYELLAKICKVGADDGKMDININFGFDFSDNEDSK